MNPCPFCAIVAGEQAATLVHESPSLICFLPRVQDVPGHTIIASRAHYASMSDAPEELGAALFATCQALAEHYRAQQGATGFNLLSAHGLAAQQSVMHLHFHFLPRQPDDGLDAWPRFQQPPVNA